MTDYEKFLESKIEIAPVSGFDVSPDDLNPALLPHQRDSVLWALHGGRRAIFASFGLGKSVIQIEFCHQCLKHYGGQALIVLPLGVRQEFTHDAVEILGYEAPKYITHMSDIQGAKDGEIFITNYERVRDGDIDPKGFTAVSLDEAAVLRSFGSKTYQTFLPKFKGVKYKMVATATPAPNKLKELIHYSGFLEIIDTGQALTRFFQRDSTKANNLTLYPHKEEEFWFWVSTWALYISKPSDLGYSDEGYDIPPMEVRVHVLNDEYCNNVDRDGQYKLINDTTASLQEASREKKQSIEARAREVTKILLDFGGIYGKEQRGNPGISAPISGSASGGTERETTGTREDLLSEPCGGNQGQEQEVGRGASRAHERAATETFRSQPGEIQSSFKTVVQRSPGEIDVHNQSREAETGVWDNHQDQRRDDGRTEMALRDMRDGVLFRREDDSAAYRSQSCDGGSERDSLQPLQFGAWNVPRFSASVDERCRLSGGQIVLWADLNAEQRRMELICKELGLSYVSIYGFDKDSDKLKKIEKWKNKEVTVFISKREMYGCGVNLQQAHKMIFCGIDYQFHSFIQSIHRVYRFLQTEHVIIDIIYMEAEEPIYKALMEKWKLHDQQQERMREIVMKYGLSGKSQIERLKRSMGVKRTEVKGNRFTAINEDCVVETARMPENSVDMILTSIPFSNHYEYTPNYSDFGHNENTERFFEQMDYLSPNLLRVLKPGRVFCCHVKDRVLFGNATGTGMPTMEPFHAMCIQHYMKHGFQYFGMITIVTDVVRENNQTYRLGWTEQCKDGSKMGVGCPEYVLLFRKLPTDTSTAYADEPVTKTKEEYTRAQWQLDAHAFWRDGGDRLLTKDELMRFPVDRLQAAYRKYSRDTIYDYHEHMEMCKKLDADGHLPATFMVMAPGSWNDDVWDDIVRMKTLNSEQKRRDLQLHVCLAEGSLILTRRGYVPIENIEIGDKVLTHKGNWKPVIAKACTGEKETVQTKAQGVAQLITTPDHKFWARTAGTRPSEPKRGMQKAEPEWIEAQNLNGCYVNAKLPTEETTDLTHGQWWIIGRYLADGHVGTRGDYFISVGKSKQHEFELCAGEYAGTRADRGSCFQYRLKGLPDAMRQIIEKCGRGAKNKQVPIEGLCLPKDYAESLLCGYLSGDGSITGNATSATSVSRALLLGIAMLVQRVRGKTPSVFRGKAAGKHTIEGREVNAKQEWVLSWRDGNHCRNVMLDDGAWKRVKQIIPTGVKTVWSIEVADDASYTAEGCIVKNCPLQTQTVERLINRYSNEGDLIFDPFGGIGTVPYMALKMNRRGLMTELNFDYFRDAVGYLQAEEDKQEMPTLFDLMEGA